MATDCEYDMNRLNHIGDDLVAAFNDGYAHGKADAERKRGKWMEIRHGIGTRGRCSECMSFNWITPYCPNCGAQMDGDSDV